MKWLKLDCDFRNDPKILALSQQFGGKEACSFWVLLLSYVGANGMPDCEIIVTSFGPHSLNLIASFLHTKPKVATSMLSACAHLGLITPERWMNDSVISIPNMLKRVDDYTRKVRTKSVQSPEKPAVEQIENRTEESRTDTEQRESAAEVASEFEKFWIGSTKRGSKKDALAEWKKIPASIRTSGDISAGMAAWQKSSQWQDESKQTHIHRWLKRAGWTEIVPRNGNGGSNGQQQRQFESKEQSRERRALEGLADLFEGGIDKAKLDFGIGNLERTDRALPGTVVRINGSPDKPSL